MISSRCFIPGGLLHLDVPGCRSLKAKRQTAVEPICYFETLLALLMMLYHEAPCIAAEPQDEYPAAW
jgi:hypothetical protein